MVTVKGFKADVSSVGPLLRQRDNTQNDSFKTFNGENFKSF